MGRGFLFFQIESDRINKIRACPCNFVNFVNSAHPTFFKKPAGFGLKYLP